MLHACLAQPGEETLRCTSPGCRPIQYMVDRCPIGYDTWVCCTSLGRLVVPLVKYSRAVSSAGVAASGSKVVGAPVDDYVRDFVSEVPKAHVLTLRWVMRQPTASDALDGPELGPEVTIRNAARLVLDADKPIRVVEDGNLLGVVSDDDVLRVVIAEDMSQA